MAKNATKSYTEIASIADAHAVLLARIEKLSWSKYQVVEAAKEHGVAKSVVYEFIAEGKERQRLNMRDYIGLCLAVGLTVEVGGPA